VRFKPDAGMRLGPAGFSSKNAVDVSGLKGIIEKYPGASVARTFEETEDTIERQVARISSTAGRKLPPLSNYYNITTADATQAAGIVHDLKQDPLIEEAYIEPPAVPALYAEPAPTGAQEAPPATPDFSPQQGYLDVAPGGIDARHAWTLPGGKGEAVQIIDIEGGWNFNHEDLLQNQGGVVGGTATDDLGWVNHGTAVQGEIGGDEDNPGIVGIAPRSRFSAVSIFGTGNSVAKAIKTAADKLAPGDVILIELHRAGPNANGVGQFGYIAVEWWSADFDAVQYAVAKGILVIAAAGNGSQDLDDAIYEGKFDRSQRDSGAILVGAGAPPTGTFGPDRSRLGFSNYGASIDAQGWGRDVTTAGYGDLQGGSDQNKWYTSTFSGTSSASPIVVGAVANLQGIQKARGGPLLTYQRVRQILRQTGSPQVDGPNGPATQRIGSRPDLRAASALLVPALSVGIATRYWLEAEAYPSGSLRSLWLLVDAAWCRLDNPAPSVEDAVQRAMLGENSQVRVWFQGEEILGLVVQGT
jgi:hypothetical protein